MANPQYLSDSQLRVIDTILALFTDAVQGVAPSVLAKTVGCDPAQMTRCLANLAHRGIAARDETTGLWCLTPRLPQQAIKVWTALDRAEARLAQAKQRFTRNPD